MDTAVVEFNSLPDPVWSAAQNHDLGPVRVYRIFIFRIISRVIVGAVFCTADMNAFPGFCYAE